MKTNHDQSNATDIYLHHHHGTPSSTRTLHNVRTFGGRWRHRRGRGYRAGCRGRRCRCREQSVNVKVAKKINPTLLETWQHSYRTILSRVREDLAQRGAASPHVAYHSLAVRLTTHSTDPHHSLRSTLLRNKPTPGKVKLVSALPYQSQRHQSEISPSTGKLRRSFLLSRLMLHSSGQLNANLTFAAVLISAVAEVVVVCIAGLEIPLPPVTPIARPRPRRIGGQRFLLALDSLALRVGRSRNR